MERASKTMIANARKLRRNMTKEERHLWYDFLKDLPIMVHRQKIIESYIVDFYIAEKKIVIELDGSQHFEDAGIQEDRQRDQFLQSRGMTVLRYSNRDVNQHFRGVCEDIWNRLELDKRIKASPLGEAGKNL